MAGQELTSGAQAEFDWTDFAAAQLRRSYLVRHAGDDDTPKDMSALIERARADADGATEQFRAQLDEGDSAVASLAAACDLDELDAAVLAVLASCEIDAETLRIALSLSPSARSRPTAGLLFELFGSGGVRALAPGAALDRAGLVEVEAGAPLATAGLAVPRAVVWRLLDEAPDLDELGPDTRAERCPPTMIGSATRVLVSGDDRVRRIQTAMAAAFGLLFYVGPPPQTEEEWRALTRRAGVDGAGVVLELDAPPGPDVRRWIRRCPHLSWALCRRDPIDLAALPPDQWTDLRASEPDVSASEWTAVFAESAVPARRPTAAQLRTALNLNPVGRDPAEVIRRVASGTLLKHATRITPRVGWDELILPDTQRQRLHDLVNRYRYRTVVHDEWGLPLYPSPGVVTLFSGPSGTGKTTTAEVIAHDLGVDMFRVDLSALVSKYIGETEKNLEEIFSAAHAGDYLLLFDEADSLFGSRSKVTDARDRYANMEVSYLLQRLETYDGFVVLTSNFQGNIDQAFLRRIHVTVHFAVPSVEDRTRIWERSLGDAPLDDLDLAFIADKFDLTGGSIRNAALTAAFYAAAGQRKITMVDVLLAITQEMIKLGRRPNDDQYGRWLSALKD